MIYAKALVGGMVAVAGVAAASYAAHKSRSGGAGDGKLRINFASDGTCRYEVSGTDDQTKKYENACNKLFNDQLDINDENIVWGTMPEDKAEEIRKQLGDKYEEVKQKLSVLKLN